MEEKRKRATGSATMIAATPLKRIPSFMKNPRRESEASAGGVVSVLVDIFFSPIISPLFLGVLRLRLLRIVHSGIRLPRILRAPGCQPRNYVCDFLIGHWIA